MEMVTMSKKQSNEQVGAFLNKESRWQEEYKYLGALIFNETELEEVYKWIHPCYMSNNKDMIPIYGFKDYAVLLFHKSVILEDKCHTLIQQTEKARVVRQPRFENLTEIQAYTEEVKCYLAEATRAEKTGEKAEMKKAEECVIPKELEARFEGMPRLESSFCKLMPGRRHQYIHHIGQAKRSEAKQKCVEEYTNQVLKGEGMHDK